MKRAAIILILLVAPILSIGARDYDVRGPQGGISFKISLPEGFNPETDKCPMVILMHGSRIQGTRPYPPRGQRLHRSYVVQREIQGSLWRKGDADCHRRREPSDQPAS